MFPPTYTRLGNRSTPGRWVVGPFDPGSRFKVRGSRDKGPPGFNISAPQTVGAEINYVSPGSEESTDSRLSGRWGRGVPRRRAYFGTLRTQRPNTLTGNKIDVNSHN